MVTIPNNEFEWYEVCGGNCHALIKVAEVSSSLSTCFDCTTNQVRMTRPYLQKLVFKHRLTAQDMHRISVALSTGLFEVLRASSGRGTLLIHDNYVGVSFKIGLKSSRNGNEIWLSTAHRISKKEIRRLRRREAEK